VGALTVSVVGVSRDLIDARVISLPSHYWNG